MLLKSPPIGKAFTTPVFICPSCQFGKALSSFRSQNKYQSDFQVRRRSPQNRHASIASSATIDGRKEIPVHFQQLHNSLSSLQHKAAVYINLSQLQLALRSLESENPVIRVAVLGLNGQQGARRLARALLADPLAAESEWEKELVKEEEDRDGRALILRYCEEPKLEKNHPLAKTFLIPSSKLLAHNLELLIQAIPPDPQGGTRNNGYLVPGLELLSSNTGRTSTVLYPVHKAFVFAEGLQNLPSLPKSETGDAPHAQISLLRGVIDESWTNLQSIPEQRLSPINLTHAESAVESIRKSLEMAVGYEHAWSGSGLANLSSWLAEGLDGKPTKLKPALRKLIETVLENARLAISHQEGARINHLESRNVPASTRRSLDQTITRWADIAHTELRDQLGNAFSGRDWKKLTWWKLFWRVDDVTFILGDILQRIWLVEAEKDMIWHFGRIEQAGLGDPAKLSQHSELTAQPENSESKIGDLPPPPPFTKEESIPERISRPWPQEISRARSHMSSITIPPLQALSQRLLFQTISTTVLTSSLSTLLYISISTTSIYEAGAFAAFGFVYSMRSLQKKWSVARAGWEATVREEGRRVLRKVEEGMRVMVREGGKGVLDKGELEESRVALEGMERTRKALEELH